MRKPADRSAAQPARGRRAVVARALRAAPAAGLLLALAACSTSGDVSPFPELAAAPPPPPPGMLSTAEKDAAIAEMRRLAADNNKR